MLFETRVHGLHLEDVEKLVVVRGRASDRMDYWERKFPLCQVLTETFRCGHLTQVISTHHRYPGECGQRLTCSEQRLL